MKNKSTKGNIPTIQVRSPEQLGNSIRRIRKLKNLSQAELAKKAGVTQVTVSRTERGGAKVEVGTLLLIFAALSVDLAVTPRPHPANDSLEGLY